jgi:hypothetical protein
MNGNRTMGYSDQDWDGVQLEIARRVQRLMAANLQLGYGDATEAVFQADPSLAQADWDAIQVELTRRVKETMAGNNQLDYNRALQAVMAGDPNICRRYYAAKNRLLSAPGVQPRGSQGDEVALEIQPLVQAKVAASERGGDAGSALKAVLYERPDLARRLRNSMR